MIKKIVLFLLALVAVYGAAFSPYSITNTLETKSRLEASLSEQASAKTARDSAVTSLNNARNAFESERTFDIHYTDIVRIKKLIDSVAGVSFVSLNEADVNAGYAQGPAINIDDYDTGTESDGSGQIPLPPALMLTIMAENTAAGLKIIDRFEMPICQINTTEPGRIEIVFLTGGDS